MMHGFGPRILAALPKTGPGLTAREVQADLESSLSKAPKISTIRAHLYELKRLGAIQCEARRYWRLVDSALDVSPGFRLASEVSA